MIFDVPSPLRPLHLAAVHETGTGQAEGRVREESHHKNFLRGPAGDVSICYFEFLNCRYASFLENSKYGSLLFVGFLKEIFLSKTVPVILFIRLLSENSN